MKKVNFDQTPNLTENFDQLKMSGEIRSSDHPPLKNCTLSDRNQIFLKLPFVKFSTYSNSFITIKIVIEKF